MINEKDPFTSEEDVVTHDAIKSIEEGVEKARSLIEDLSEHYDPKTLAERIQHHIKLCKDEGALGFMQMVQKEAQELAFAASLTLLHSDLNMRHKGESLRAIGRTDATKLIKYLPELSYGNDPGRYETQRADIKILEDLGEIFDQLRKLS